MVDADEVEGMDKEGGREKDKRTETTIYIINN